MAFALGFLALRRPARPSVAPVPKGNGRDPTPPPAAPPMGPLRREVDSLATLGGQDMAFLTCREEPGTRCGADWAAARKSGDGGALNRFNTADRLIKAALAIAGDDKCHDHVVDASGGRRTANEWAVEAANLFRKCRVVVLRGAMDPKYMRDYSRRFAAYVAAARNGSIEGTSTNGEKLWLKTIGDKRWLALVPEAFGTPELLAPFWIRKLLGHPRLLDSNFRLNDLGAAIAEPGAGAQLFHVDDDYILGRESMAINGVGGHDLPSTAITVLHPLWPEAGVDEAHGPTEFCLGLCGTQPLGRPASNFAKISLRCSRARPLPRCAQRKSILKAP